jgi:hypothetical protein
MESKIVHIRIDNWYDMGEANQYLDELMAGEHDEDVNYAEVWYDMASIFCITTTEEYAKEHKLTGHITDIEKDFLKEYFPEYNPEQFGCSYDDEYKGWAPYKQFNAEMAEALRKKGLIKNDDEK